MNSLRSLPARNTAIDRRASARSPAQGEVVLILPGPESGEIRARLMDISRDGFRAMHDCPLISSGLCIEFRIGAKSAKALVVWSRITASTCESGFHILTDTLLG